MQFHLVTDLITTPDVFIYIPSIYISVVAIYNNVCFIFKQNYADYLFLFFLLDDNFILCHAIKR